MDESFEHRISNQFLQNQTSNSCRSRIKKKKIVFFGLIKIYRYFIEVNDKITLIRCPSEFDASVSCSYKEKIKGFNQLDGI